MVIAPDIRTLHHQRHRRLREVMESRGVPALLTPDPVNIGYACGHRNMSVYGMLGPSRFLLLIAGGPTIMFEFVGCEHLSSELSVVDEVRQTSTISANSGENYRARLERFAADVTAECRRHHPDDMRLAIERVDFEFTDALRANGLGLLDATAVLLEARRIKQPAELAAMRVAIDRVQLAVGELESSLRDGVTENEAWAAFHRDFIARDGEYVVARLFQSGPNTFPYFRESGERAMRAGDLVCLDTDATAYLGYSVDFSRTFLCEADRGTLEQRDLFALALEQLEHNAGLIAPGMSFDDFAAKAWPMPERYRPYGYYCIAHGVGVAGEHPTVPIAIAGEPYSFPGEFEVNMVMSVESYIGDPETHQGVKLENQYLVTDNGVELLTDYPLADSLT